jgi:hypothetical protein
MDKKLAFQGGEPNFESSDYLYTQYSNYYALYGMAQGLDYAGTGTVITGCEVFYDFDSTTNTLLVDVSDGYLGILQEMVNVKATPQLNYAVTFPNPGVVIYVYAAVNIQYNPKGDKTFIDSTPRQTFQETRIELSAGTVATPPTGTILLATISLTNGVDSTGLGDPVALNMFETGVTNFEADLTGGVQRNSINTTVVTPNSLHDAIGDWSILELTSTVTGGIGTGTQYFFTLPTNVQDIELVNAKVQYTLVSPTITYLNPTPVDISGVSFVSEWLPASNTYKVYFDVDPGDLAAFAFATFLIKYN